MANLIDSFSGEVQAMMSGLAQYIAARGGDGRRLDGIAHPTRDVDPMQEASGLAIAYSRAHLHQDAIDYVKTVFPGKREDASFTAMFARQLEYVYTWTADIEYPDLKSRNLIPVDTSVPSGAEYFTYNMFDKVAKAAMLHSYAKNSFPESDVYGDQFRQAVKGIGDKYSFSVQDMRAAQMSGMPLEQKKAESARYGIEKKLELIACVGDAPTGLFGITNAPGVAATAKVSPVGTWAQQIVAAIAAGTLTATVQAILQDVNAMANAIYTQTLGTHKPTTLILPTGAFAVLATTPRAPGFTEDTILDFILASSPWLNEITDWAYLNANGAFNLTGTFSVTNASESVTATLTQATQLVPGSVIYFSSQPTTPYTVLTVVTTAITLTSNFTGTTASGLTATQVTGEAVMYEKNPRILQLVIPQEFEQFPPQIDGLTWEIYCHLRTGGVNVMRPLAVTTMSGIA